MHTLPLHLDAGSDVRLSLEALAREQAASGYVLSVVGNLSTAVFQCPGRPAPTRLRGELEIITLSGTLSPEGVHLHLSFSDGDCRVWGGHLEPGTLVLRGADLLLGFLPLSGSTTASVAPAVAMPLARSGDAAAVTPAAAAAPSVSDPPRVEIAVLPGCPWSARALRMLRTLSIPHRVLTVETDAQRSEVQQRSGSPSLPQVFVDGQPIGGYDALADCHARHELEPLRLS
ncbi:MAG: PCC domain-containing protein [Cyanobium sp.]